MHGGSVNPDGLIERLIAFSAHNRVFVIALTLFACLLGWQALQLIPLDAIPDISDTQVIIYTKWNGRPPNLVEDQVTYPVVTALMSAPGVRTVRGSSDFGYSYVYVIFEDGTDLYWARSRVLEYLARIQGTLPPDAKMEMGPDATAVGWVYQYALVDRTGQHDLADLRTLQDWFLRYQLQSVEGVAEVASVGGHEKQYVVELEPTKLRAYGITVDEVIRRVQASNRDVGGRVLEFAGREYMVWGHGYAGSTADLAAIGLGASANGTALTVGQLGRVIEAPNMRRGVAELNGEGECVGGVVLMRQGENALNVIARVKTKLDDIRASLPPGVELVEVYDRSDLISRAIATLTGALKEEIFVVSLVIMLFLLHVPSALIPIVTIPVAVLLSFIPMQQSGLTSNIMSLGGIAVAIGALVDGAIVVVENCHKRLEEWEAEGRQESSTDVIIRAVQEVGRPTFYSLLIIAVSFLPVFALTGQEGRMFRPLALTKTLAMAIAALLAVTLDPALRLLLMRTKEFTFRPKPLAWLANVVLVGKVHSEEKHPVSRFLFALYEPVCKLTLRVPVLMIVLALLALVATIPAWQALGTEFMPPLEEGSILYMPTTFPGLSVTEARRILQEQDRSIRAVPEVASVFGKAGRFESSTDPAPFSMVETVIMLKPESEWRARDTWYSSWAPEWLRAGLLRPFWPDRTTYDDLIGELNETCRFPGWQNAWTMPIRTRIDMLATGIRTPVGIKVMGRDLQEIERLAIRLEEELRTVDGARSVFAERVTGGYFIKITPRREALARYGIALDEALMQVENALGGMEVSRTVEGRERYTIAVRYARDMRQDLDAVRNLLLPLGAPRTPQPALPDLMREGQAMPGSAAAAAMPAPMGGNIPLAQVATVEVTEGPAMIRDEDGLLTAYVYIDVRGRDLGSVVDALKARVAQTVTPLLPPGYTLEWAGQYEFQERAEARLALLIPLTIGIIFILLYLNTRSLARTLMVALAVPFSAIGAVWLLWLLDYNMSVAVWVGLIALLGVDAETGIFMLLFLDLAYDEAKAKGKLATVADLRAAILHGAVRRIRPKFMTVATTFIGLLPLMWSSGAGADMMKRVAAPMVGGLFTSFLLELLIYPPLYLLWRRHEVESPASLPAEG